MRVVYKYVVFALFISVVALIFVSVNPKAKNSNNTNNSNLVQSSKNQKTIPLDITTQSAKTLMLPIPAAQSRITKKPFGIKVSPNNSPVLPERFSGFHTGVDFETFSNEQSIDVPISAICAGPLLEKKWASGYGGVAVQKCTIDNQDVTVVYGHLKLASISIPVGAEISAGEQIAVLGKAFSQETDGERKHLHLGIHKGTAINILGYVSSASELQNWLDVSKYF